MSLPAALLERHDCVFQWGVSDCALWARDGVEAFTGHRIELPAYSNEAEARAILDAEGGLEAMVAARLGDPIPLREARAGDVVVCSFRQTGIVLGIADPPVFWLRGDRAIIPVSLDLAIRAYPCHKLPSRS